MDVTIVSPLHGTGIPMPHSRNNDGAVVQRATDRNRNVDYPDVEASPLAQLLSLGCEIYGRWSEHCLTLVRQLAKHKSCNYHQYLQASIEQACHARWWNLLSVTVQKLVSISILREHGHDLFEGAACVHAIPVEELLDFAR